MNWLSSLEIEMIWMTMFILSYSILSINTSKHKGLIYLNNLIYSFSGLLLTIYVFQLSSVEQYKEYIWVAGFLTALTFKELLPVIMESIVTIVSVKLKEITKKIAGSK